MTPMGFVVDAIGLGFFALFGGAYGLLYAASELRGERRLGYLAIASYAAQSAVLLAVVTLSALGPIWKVFLIGSGIAYYFIPRVTLRYLKNLHASGEIHS
ncbi:hypothetical protein EPN52_09755 [bacterium]|nr:MAG: hypothetical protein EPN52_09755 [bacterium]